MDAASDHACRRLGALTCRLESTFLGKFLWMPVTNTATAAKSDHEPTRFSPDTPFSVMTFSPSTLSDLGA